MQLGVMIFCVIEDDLYLPCRMATHSPEVTHKKKKGLGIKRLGAMEHEFAVPQTHGSKIANALAGWMVVNNWLFHLGRNPHSAPRTM